MAERQAHGQNSAKYIPKKILRIAKHANKARIRTGALSQTHLGAPTDDVAALLGGGVRHGRRRGAGGGAQIGPGRHGSRSRMFRPRASGDVRRRLAGPAGRSGAIRWPARVWGLGANGGIFELGVRRKRKRRRSEGKRVTADEWMGNIFAVGDGF